METDFVLEFQKKKKR